MPPVRILVLDHDGHQVWASPWGEGRVVVAAGHLAQLPPSYSVIADVADVAHGYIGDIPAG